mmetsp:Transcript_35841/g.83537  ORF Transcript_35841/g.83537 Transcript_35841/m.83537 type:complete len:325 (+) Transcript_35841:2318-3292(+)
MERHRLCDHDHMACSFCCREQDMERPLLCCHGPMEYIQVPHDATVVPFHSRDQKITGARIRCRILRATDLSPPPPVAVSAVLPRPEKILARPRHRLGVERRLSFCRFGGLHPAPRPRRHARRVRRRHASRGMLRSGRVVPLRGGRSDLPGRVQTQPGRTPRAPVYRGAGLGLGPCRFAYPTGFLSCADRRVSRLERVSAYGLAILRRGGAQVLQVRVGALDVDARTCGATAVPHNLWGLVENMELSTLLLPAIHGVPSAVISGAQWNRLAGVAMEPIWYHNFNMSPIVYSSSKKVLSCLFELCAKHCVLFLCYMEIFNGTHKSR